jgi:signal transduction histidine kinase
VLPYFTEQALSRNLSIDADINDAPVVSASKQLMEILISNLILNAISHNIMNGSITIKATHKQIEIGNTSDQPQLNVESLFKRFGNVSAAGNSNGLGLAIIKQICGLHNWKVSYHYKFNKHYFTVRF